MRNFNDEFHSSEDRKYVYDFDYLMHDYFLRVFAPHFNGSMALELGCFEGAFTAKLMHHFPSMTVIEASSDLIAIARVRTASTPTFLCSTFEEASVGQQKFDAIFLMHTMEHLDDPKFVLQRIREWLSPGGRLYVAVPNANAISRQIAVKMGVVPFQACVTPGEYSHGHRRTYTLDSLEHEIRQSGLTLEQSGGVFFKPFANFQFDKMMAQGAIDTAYLEGCYELGKKYPDFCASVFAICR